MSHREKEKEKEKKKEKSHSREKSKRTHSHSKEASESKDKNESKSIKSKSHSHSKKKLKSSRSSSKALSKRNSNKSSLNDKYEKSYFSSMKVITSINNELEVLNNDINSKFKNSNIFNKNYLNNILFEKKDNLIDDYNVNANDYDNNYYNNNFFEIKNSFNNPKIKKMENLYLYKQKYNSINNHMIYKQPDSQKRTLPINNKFKHNSFYRFKPKQNINRFKLRRNLFFPNISSFPLQQSKKFNIDNINLACKILLEDD